MKLAFSTLGCPNWELDKIVETAERLGDVDVLFSADVDDAVEAAGWEE
jgi:hypothetical protein